MRVSHTLWSTWICEQLRWSCVRQPLKGFRGRHRNHFSNFTSSKWWCHWWWKRRTLAFLPLARQTPNSASSQVLHPVLNAKILCTLSLGFSAVSTTFLAKGRGLGTDTSQWSTPGHHFHQRYVSVLLHSVHGTPSSSAILDSPTSRPVCMARDWRDHWRSPPDRRTQQHALGSKRWEKDCEKNDPRTCPAQKVSSRNQFVGKLREPTNSRKSQGFIYNVLPTWKSSRRSKNEY